MNVDNRQEMAERFRLYGEIFMLCVEIVGEQDVYDFRFDIDEMMEDVEVESFNVEEDNGDCQPCDGFYFEDGMLWVEYGIISCSFTNVSSVTLEKLKTLVFNYVNENKE